MMVGGFIFVDFIFNFLLGCMVMLKKEVVVEKKEFFMKFLEKMFMLDYFVDKLKIFVEYVKGFEYYVVENESFIKILNLKNKIFIEFLLGELVVKYKEIIVSEK